ncbi:major facilitator superfamily domain-containing protein [Xylariaceae sp. FL1651]|nr:major facilitator superfamily domain-containing protein [Xylariaceae sp. FL1651]
MSIMADRAAQQNTALPKENEKTANEGPVDVEAVSGRHEDDEALERLEKLKKQYGATWDGPDDPADPYNWSSTKKVSIAIAMGLGSLVTLVSASVTAAALDDIAADLGLDPATAQISFSIYFLGLAFGPFPIAAISELNGRRNIWIASNLWYILWNTLCPVGYSKGLMLAGRFLAATGASAGNTLTGPVMTDVFREKDRGKSLAIAGLLPYLGPALGPIIGGSVSQLINWPWLFYITSILDAVALLIGILVLRESYTPVLLRRKAARLGQSEQQQAADGTPISPPPPPPPTTSMAQRAFWRDFFSQLGTSMLRPFQILVYRPVMHVVTLNLGLAFGIYTLTLSTFAQLWIGRYAQSPLSSSLHYIAISIGITLATQVGGRAMDWTYRRLRERDGGGARGGRRRTTRSVSTTTAAAAAAAAAAGTAGTNTPVVASSGKLPPGKPEYRAPYMVPGVLLMPAGLFWYGWSAQYHYHWAVVDVGAAVFTMGSFTYSQALLAYTLDEFKEYGASANAALRVLSQVLGFAFPIFAPKLYDNLGYGWGNSLLAFIFIVLAFPIPLCLWVWGEKLRAIGRQRTQ